MKKILGMILCIIFAAVLSLAPATAFAAVHTQGTVSANSLAGTARVTGVSLSKTSLALTAGKTYKLTATVKPGNASNKKVTWKSGNKAVATVSSTGNVKGIKAGSTYIYVYTADGNKSAKCKVIVKEPVNTYGNTGGNIANGGTATKQGDWIYYSNANNSGYLFKVKTDGTGKQKLCSDKWVSYINVVGNWVYYSNGSDHNRLYKVSTDGKTRKKLSSDSVASVTVVGSWIYYVNKARNNSADIDLHSVYKIRADGTGKTMLTDNIADEIFYGDINIAGNWIYYTGHIYDEGDYIFKVSTSGGRASIVDYSSPERLLVADGWIYYTDVEDYCFYKMRTDGSGKTKLSSSYCSYINVSGGWIYYAVEDEASLYKMRTDGSGKQTLCVEQPYDINVVGNWIYFRSVYRSDDLYRIRTDGTGLQKVK